MRILYFSDNYMDGVMGIKLSLRLEVERRGNEVKFCNVSQIKNVLKISKQFNPAQIWLAHSDLTIDAETKYRLDVPVVGFGFSDPYDFTINRLANYDAYVTNNFNTYRIASPILPTHYNPVAIDKRFHKKLDIKKDIPVSFIGRGVYPRFKNPYARIEMVNMVRGAGIEMHTFGEAWPTHKYNHGPVTGAKFLEAINRSVMGVDMMPINGPLAHRLVEYGACGVPIITRYKPEVSKVLGLGEVITYESIRGLIYRIKLYTKHSGIASAIGERARIKCLRKHDITNRVDALMAFLQRAI